MSSNTLAWALALFVPACLAPSEGEVADTTTPRQTDGGLQNANAGDDTRGAPGTSDEVSELHPEEVTDPPEVSEPAEDVTEPQAGEVEACEGVGGQCRSDGGCCSRICTAQGERVGYCLDPVVDGAFCEADHWCRSGRCAESTCIPVDCIATGVDCRVDAACCSGICSYTGVYALETTCIEPRQLGEPCSEDNWCASGFCVNGLCAVGACLEENSDCSFNEDRRCCYPLFCSWRGDYTPGYCTAPQPAGASCADARWCRSGACSADGVCQ